MGRQHFCDQFPDPRSSSQPVVGRGTRRGQWNPEIAVVGSSNVVRIAREIVHEHRIRFPGGGISDTIGCFGRLQSLLEYSGQPHLGHENLSLVYGDSIGEVQTVHQNFQRLVRWVEGQHPDVTHNHCNHGNLPSIWSMFQHVINVITVIEFGRRLGEDKASVGKDGHVV